MPGDVTHAVYSPSTSPCNRPIHRSFTIDNVNLYWSDLVKLAKLHLQKDEKEFRKALAEQDISAQTVTNWKGPAGGPRRAIPLGKYKVLAEILGISTDELHGYTPSAAPDTDGRRTDAQRITKALMNLEDDDRERVMAIITSLLDKKAPSRRRAR